VGKTLRTHNRGILRVRVSVILTVGLHAHLVTLTTTLTHGQGQGRHSRWKEGKPKLTTVTKFVCNNNNNNNNTKFVKRRVAVASEALANRTVKKHTRRRTNVL